ncbi:response regulator [Azoarcus olearius]|uniref:Virulence sensor protein BvgS n=1 Tax=Azoarcus sp. (strain BH72) TaxID=418699 RepID=A1K864_AZOSB|nr:response regulator [Azoarcus olearius]CAL95019.1 putative sensor-regulator protein [Azoarcus olearius]
MKRSARLSDLLHPETIRGKLMVLSVAGLLIGVVLVFALIVYQQQRLIRNEWADSLNAQARLIATNSEAALAFQDRSEAARLLAAVQSNPFILRARLLVGPDGAVFAQYDRGDADPIPDMPDAAGDGGAHFAEGWLIVQSRVRTGDGSDARVELVASLESMRQTEWNLALETGTMLLLALVLSLWLAGRMAHRLSAPVERISALLQRMSSNAALDERLQVQGNDEIARLAHGLNTLIDTLQARDRELNDYRQHLEELVEQRTRQLSIATAEAQQASRAKSDFLARMSHEIRTPMNAVIGLTHLALRTELSPQQRDYLRKIRGSSQALLGIINDILDFSKIEAGKLRLEQIPFTLHDVIDNLSNIVTVKAAEKGLDVLLAIDPAIPDRMRGDPLRLSQILINLGTNAVKFTERGEVVVDCRLIDKTEDCVRVRFSVTDTGIGISAAQRGLLFQSFHQADGSITRRFGGTGLGLAISKQLIEIMEGSLEVASEPGEGSTFSFVIPFGTVAGARERHYLAPEELRHKPILVVDDNPTARAMLRTMIEHFHFVADTAASGEEAILKIREAGEQGYAVVLMDRDMPGLDGIEAARRIKLDLSLPTPPRILLMASYTKDHALQEAGHGAGLDGILTKPVGPSLLFNSLLKVLGHAHRVEPEEPLFADQPTQGLAGIRGARVLLVEDNPINQQVATEFLRQAGLQVDLAGDGYEGVDRAVATAYDLILMDVQMPGMDGLEATRRIRARDSHTPIVAMTAHALDTDRERSRAAGMNGHLTKPIDPAELETTLVRWIPPGVRALPAGTLPAAADTTTEELPVIDALDGAQGLKRVGGSARLYLDLLRDFLKGHASDAERVEALVEGGDWATAGRVLHTFKGVAAALGGTELAALAVRVEDAVREQNRGAAVEALPPFTRALGNLCGALAEHFARHPGGAPAASASVGATEGPDLREGLEQAAELLRAGNSRAERVVASIAPAAHAQGHGGEVDAILAAIEDVEFDAALARVNALLARFERNG